MIKKLSIRDLELEGRRLFIRVDFNVPIRDGKVTGDLRIRSALPTIQMAIEKGARVILASHLGRPKGERREGMSLKPVAHYLSQLTDRSVLFVGDCVGPEVQAQVGSMASGQLLLLENLRFHPGETANDPDFAQQLAGLAEEYVNDAFGAAHRAHASTVGVPRILGRGAAGLLMERELDYLGRVMTEPEHPLVAILGGAKISDKIEVIDRFLELADCILLGGAMAYTFLKVQGEDVGRSLVEQEKLAEAERLLEKARSGGVKILLPKDHVVAPSKEEPERSQVVSRGAISADLMGLDIGPTTVREFKQEIESARTIIWNGPMGVFEIEAFSRGTIEVAKAVADSQALSVVGGGDSAAAVVKARVEDRISHVSTGGGASLEFLAGKKLPGIEVLSDAP